MQLPQETTRTIGGKAYRLSKLDLNVLGEFLAWGKAQLPDPFANFAERFGGCSSEIQNRAFDRASAIAENRGTIKDPETMALMYTIPGIKKLFALMLRKHHADLTETQVGELIEAGMREQGEAFLADMFPDLGPGDGKTPEQSA